MGWQAWLTLAVVAAVVVTLARDLLSPAPTILAGVIILLVCGVITPAQAFAGFSNAAPITVAALYVLARAVEKTGGLQPILEVVVGRGGGERAGLARLLVPVAGASAFLNNTPIVATLAPQVTEWAARNGRSPSRYLMPLSFAAILGGVVTLIGTSTNILVSGLLEAEGYAPLGVFEQTRVGLPIALAGVALLVLWAPRLLPERRSARRELTDETRQFVVGMVVVPGGPLDGQAVEAGGLRHLQGVYLVQVEREDQVIAPVAPTTVLQGGDRLTFVGRADQVVDLQRARGLVSAEQAHVEKFNTAQHTFFEAVVGANSPLIGTTVREASFRGRYQAAVVAIHRAGERLRAKLGDVRLKVGDTLIVLADPGFAERWRDRPDFLLIARHGGAPPAVSQRAGLVWGVALGIVTVAGMGWLPVLHASLIGAVSLVVFRALTPGEARDAVDLNVLVVIAASFGLGAAIETTGLAHALGGILVSGFAPWGRTGILTGLALATMLLTELITNNAAAALLFPVALAAAHEMGLDPRACAIAVAIAASASFLTPIGYQTNTMVYGLGGYRFTDYARLGIPLTLVTLVLLAGLL